MDETLIVIMLKDNNTGILDREIGCYSIYEHEDLIVNAYAAEENGSIFVKMKLSCEREVLDWEFDAIFDNYDSSIFEAAAGSAEEVEDCFNPTWEITFAFSEDVKALEETINRILALHKRELDAVYKVIAVENE